MWYYYIYIYIYVYTYNDIPQEKWEVCLLFSDDHLQKGGGTSLSSVSSLSFNNVELQNLQ